MKLADLEILDPSLTPLDENTEIEIKGLTTFDFPKDQSAAFIKDNKFLRKVRSKIESNDWSESFLILEAKFLDRIDGDDLEFLKSNFKALLKVDSVALCMSYISKPFYDELYLELNDMVDGRQMGTATVHPTSWIAQGAHIGEGVIIGEGVKVHSGARIMSFAKIESGSEIFPNVTIYPYVEIGKNCRIHSGTVIGADGFGYNFDKGIHHKVWHMGSVKISDDVEIGANSCVDQGTFSPTLIGRGTKIDNHVQIGHNVVLGMGVVLCGHVAIGGSAKVGDFCVFGGKAALGDGFTLGKACQVAGAGMVNCDWPDGSVVGGHPARPVKEWMKGIAYLRKMSLQ